MKHDFDVAFEILLEFEGEYTNNLNDPGGITKYGISKKSYPQLDIENLTKEDAQKIYYRDFWIPLKCNDIPSGINIALFDTAVNIGLKNAVKLFQITINYIRKENNKKEISVDGIIGNQTLGALEEVLKTHTIVSIISIFLMKRIEYYVNIISKNKKLKEFLFGWIKRTIVLYNKIINA